MLKKAIIGAFLLLVALVLVVNHQNTKVIKQLEISIGPVPVGWQGKETLWHVEINFPRGGELRALGDFSEFWKKYQEKPCWDEELAEYKISYLILGRMFTARETRFTGQERGRLSNYYSSAEKVPTGEMAFFDRNGSVWVIPMPDKAAYEKNKQPEKMVVKAEVYSSIRRLSF